MPDRSACLITLVACFGVVPSTLADKPGSQVSVAGASSPTRPLDTLQSASAFMQEIEGFEVVVSTLVRDARGAQLAPPSSGRVCFRRSEAGPQFLVETWGALGSARLSCDGETVTIADPTTRCVESRPLPRPASAWLDDQAITARFGPAAMHLLGLVLDDGLTAFRATGPERTVDLGPTRATVVPCDGVRDDEQGGEMRLAFAADGPPVPLAVAVLLGDGTVVELEFHDWTLGRPTDETMAVDAVSDWRKVATLPRPSHLPADPDASNTAPDASGDAVIAGVDSLDHE